MTSRLDRLFVLLETGSSPVTRRAAATQLGEVQRLHPHELHNLLSRLTTYLRSPTWETRIAAGQAVEAILKNVPQWDPPGVPGNDEKEGLWHAGRLRFSTFNIMNVISNSAYLMGSEGKEYDFDIDSADGDNKERLARQCQQLNSRIGLVGSESILGLSGNEPILSNKDLLTTDDLDIKPTTPFPLNNKLNVSEVVNANNHCGLSSREINRERRKARQALLKQRSRDNQEEEEPDKKKFKKEEDIKMEDIEVTGNAENLPVPDLTGSWGPDAIDWPLEGFADSLCASLFSPVWEVRHGAGTALRELLKIHGRGTGKSADMPSSQMEELHQLWLEDVSLRLVCVLALDRFGDFVSDQVVAPVRETCSQVLGSVVHLMSRDGVEKVLNVLMQLLKHTEWEARHGGLLGLKYLLAVRQDLMETLLPIAFPSALTGLSDEVDDVGAVAASSLIPVASTLVSKLPHEIPVIVKCLWDLLADQDELAAACNSFMGLLAALLNIPATKDMISPDQLVVSRLWPFLMHNASSVRRATLQTLLTLTSSKGTALLWDYNILQEALRYIYQRALIEPNLDLVEKVWNNLVVNSKLDNLLMASCPFVSTWLCLAMQPFKIPYDPSLLIHAKTTARDQKVRNRNRTFHTLETVGLTPNCEIKHFIGGYETTPIAIREKNAVLARCMASRMLGLLSCYIVKPAPGVIYTPNMDAPIDCYVKVLLAHLNSKSALQRMVTGLVITEWGRLERPVPCPDSLTSRLHCTLNENVYFDEISVSFIRLLQEAKDFVAMLKHYKIPFDKDLFEKVLTLEQIQQLSGPASQQLLSSCKLKPKVAESLESRRKSIQGSVSQTSSDQQLLTVSTQAALAGATLMLRCLPEKLNPVIKPLMESIKREENQELQLFAAKNLAELMLLCVERNPCPNNKIIANLCTFLRSDPEFTPKIFKKVDGECSSSNDSSKPTNNSANTSSVNSHSNSLSFFNNTDNYNGILTLLNQQKSAEKAAFRRANSTGGRGPGRPPITDIPIEELFGPEDDTQKLNKTQRTGATYAFTTIASHFGANLPTKLPKLWEIIIEHLQEVVKNNNFDNLSTFDSDTVAEDLVGTLQVLEITSPAIHKSLLPQLMAIVPELLKCLRNPYRAIRHLSSRCLAVLSSLDSVKIMQAVVDYILPMLNTTDDDTCRQGAAEAIACIIEKLQFDIVPYIVLLVIPLLGRMSDHESSVRQISTHCFATLIQLMPLDGAVPNPPMMTTTLVQQKDKDKAFLEQLFNPKTIPDYVVPVKIYAELRSYQQINKSPDCAPLPSLVICPPTLTGHWVYEVDKFISQEYLNPLQYAGPPLERERLRSKVKKHNLIIASYDIVRKDIDFFSAIKWNYCILDEGHVIKNGKTKSSKAIKQLVANHRLILSGTPIQNNVLELWSLFDFLMPGFLGTERQFTAKYSRPILASRDPKSSQRDQEAGVLAMEALHRQVLPFVLRRMKEDVLNDLPPKITQDYYCDLSPLQEQLYEDFTHTQAHQSLTESLGKQQNTSNIQSNTHIFQALRYLQNVCNHPKLVLSRQHPEYEKIYKQLASQNSSLNDIQHAAKLPALKQLLLDCGIGCDTVGCNTEPVVNQHRALVFCQLKAMLDIVENDLFKKNMPSVTYLRLDGSIPPGLRHSVVTQFNNDPTIDVLLLTTHVGGLGLNLTGADTVIFVEHDWSPMKDLQAMDRAHRIGQKKVVNVYRLITRATLEEKIMGLQKFKLMTANTVISGENAHMMTMGTDKLLDLFSLESKHPNWCNQSVPSGSSTSGTVTMKTVLETLPDLWEENCYEEEYDISTFVKNLNS
ncbi:TATA-binding protein-associated factor 172-like isoform X2 [Lycorma delicatula]|uniref:TATA-binding protein-associated factor 172-like isoform X2 n=1 Tax=Lycorma delicatula TaxID=130591 RepID=UPI003F510661